MRVTNLLARRTLIQLAVSIAFIAFSVVDLHAQPAGAKIRYGAYPLRAASIMKLRADLLKDTLLLRLNKSRCLSPKQARKSPYCDADHDRLINSREKVLGTKVLNSDSDRDGLTDRQELLKYRTDPTRSDTDGDGVLDGDEDANENGISDEDEDDKQDEGSTYEDLNDEDASHGCPATNFDASGNTVEFGIPAPVVGNLTRGQTSYGQNCNACHMSGEVGTNYGFVELKTRLAEAPMFITSLNNAKLADLVAYLNRTQTGQPSRCALITPTPTPVSVNTPAPTATATPVGTKCANSYFDANSNTTQFGIPSPLIGNISRGSSFYALRCSSCHGERGVTWTYAQIKTSVTGPLMNIMNVTNQEYADLAAYANRSFANVGCGGTPTPVPGPTRTPTRTPTVMPTPTSSGCSNLYFDANGNTTNFGVPSPLIGNIGAGSTLYALSCNGCHTGENTHGTSMTFAQLKASVTGPSMRITTITDQQYAHLAAYLNRALAPQNCGGTPVPTPTPLDDISSGRIIYQATCQRSGCHGATDLRRESASNIREAIIDVRVMRGITLTTQQINQLVAYLRTV